MARPVLYNEIFQQTCKIWWELLPLQKNKDQLLQRGCPWPLWVYHPFVRGCTACMGWTAYDAIPHTVVCHFPASSWGPAKAEGSSFSWECIPQHYTMGTLYKVWCSCWWFCIWPTECTYKFYLVFIIKQQLFPIHWLSHYDTDFYIFVVCLTICLVTQGIVSSCRMMSWIMIWPACGWKLLWPNLMYYFGICRSRLMKT